MATKIFPSTNNIIFESECKEMHDSLANLNKLALSLASRSKLEKRQIKETYTAMYGEDITNSLKNMSQTSKIDSKLREMLFLWMSDSHERDAIVAREALEVNADPNYKALVEIFVGRKSSHVMLVKHAYRVRFKRQLDQDIIHLEQPNPYQKILIALSTSHEAHQADISQHIANCDAKRLYGTGEGSSGAVEEAVVLEILSKRSIPQMKLTFCCYKHIYGHDYTKFLKSRKSGEFEDALRFVIKCMCNPPNYYAKVLHKSIKGTTAKDKKLIAQVIINRAEIDIEEIKRRFKKRYVVEVKDAIYESIKSEDYRDFLVALATKVTSAI